MYAADPALLHGSLYQPGLEHDACGIGVVANVRGQRSNGLLRQALTVLMNLRHRGACGCEPNTGDGAGILMQLPHAFFEQTFFGPQAPAAKPGHYAVGMLFLPPDPVARRAIEARFAAIVGMEGQRVLGWRTVPADGSSLGATARARQPVIRQVFVGRAAGITSEVAFDRKLYVIRRRAEDAIRYSGAVEGGDYFYVASLSCRTIVYKGMLMAAQLQDFYADLAHPAMDTAIAVVHSRFSTNTFPSWERAQPFRYVCHNGEINTLRGNINWMHAREPLLESEAFGDDLGKVLPAIAADGSDSAMFDNVLELLVQAGRSLPHALMMMIPEPWSVAQPPGPHTGQASDHGLPAEGPWDPAAHGTSAAKRAFYAYHSCMMEPWDGPAAMAFTDGTLAGAVLDRNGLRPARYSLTRDGLLVLASETGVLYLAPETILRKGRLGPGQMLLVDTAAGRVIEDEEARGSVAAAAPYQQWLDRSMIGLEDVPLPAEVPEGEPETLGQRQRAFGYTYEDLNIILAPMARDGVEPVGSMGTDTPLAVLSERPQILYNYFQQLFAQVTNPPVDANRESLMTSKEVTLGSERNMLRPGPQQSRQLRLSSPVLTNADLARIRHIDSPGFRAVTLPTTFRPGHARAPADGTGIGLRAALDQLCKAADSAIVAGANILILSDRGVDRAHAPIPALLAVSAVHHYLIRQGTRTRVGLVVESGEPREVHHLATLIGYGASAVNPYLVYETLADLIARGALQVTGHGEGDPGSSPLEQAIANYNRAALKGIVKVMSKMGICSIDGYRGAQIFEAVGIAREVIDAYFTFTVSRIGGVGLDVIAREAELRHEQGFDDPTPYPLDSGGQYQWRVDGEEHLLSPLVVHLLQRACRTNDYDVFERYAALVDDPGSRGAPARAGGSETSPRPPAPGEEALPPATPGRVASPLHLRHLLEIVPAGAPVPLDEVEPAASIVRRFKTGAMSYGSISQEAHEALAVAMNRIGGKSNTGEGGEDPARYESAGNKEQGLFPVAARGPACPNSLSPTPSSDRNSAIKQVASARFGVTSDYLVHASEIQIKIAQGAKPGEGGQLPGRKVYPWIARVRHSTPGVGLISPPPHHDIYSIEDLAELIFDLKNANPQARISVKLVSEVGVGTIAAGVAKGHADVILVSGYDGGTGASPQSAIKHAGLPWELAVAETHQTLLVNNLRSRVVIETDGQLRTGRDVVIAALLGAEEFGFATAPLIALGCTMMRACHLDTCPAGIATQNPELRKRFTGEPQHVINFMFFIARQVRELMAGLGFRSFDEMVGRVDRLRQQRRGASEDGELDHFVGVFASQSAAGPVPAAGAGPQPAEETGRPLQPSLGELKTRELDLSAILSRPDVPPEVGRYCQIAQDHGLEATLDRQTLIPLCRSAIERGERVAAALPIRNADRAAGTMLGSEVTRRCGAAGLPEDTISLRFTGSAGQSFGAFLPPGITLALEGDANDYAGKGLSGGKIIVYPPAACTFAAEENVIAGNVAFYGATSGEAYIRGLAGERFCVRNSGVQAVVEGIGDHGCEYMTGGRVVILGPTGRNFAAGMSGGIAYVFDAAGDFAGRCNQEMVLLEGMDPEEVRLVRGMVERHARHTGSELARRLLANWPEQAPHFVRVMPRDYKRVLQALGRAQVAGLDGDAAVMWAFEANKADAARVSGD